MATEPHRYAAGDHVVLNVGGTPLVLRVIARRELRQFVDDRTGNGDLLGMLFVCETAAGVQQEIGARFIEGAATPEQVLAFTRDRLTFVEAELRDAQAENQQLKRAYRELRAQQPVTVVN
jgi:hypothetical protein